MQEYLAFVDEIGRTVDGKYIYRFDFTKNTDVVWGEYFNIAPAIIVPDLQPDKECLSFSAKAVFPREMITAKKNSCYSMQDCIDGIISLFFSEIDENTFEISDGIPFSLPFGAEYDEIVKLFNKVGISFFDKNLIETIDESSIDDLINSGELDNNNEEDDDF